jgi:hypothetical protein
LKKSFFKASYFLFEVLKIWSETTVHKQQIHALALLAKPSSNVSAAKALEPMYFTSSIPTT